jgi:hypothetical protein
MRFGGLGRLGAGVGVIFATVALGAAPALAFDCFNPTKDAHAPTAGVNYTITGFGPNGPILTQTGPGQGHGGFVAIAPGVFGNTDTVYTHDMGSGPNPHGEVGGPGSHTQSNQCNQKGIDYLDDCGLVGGP